MTWLEGAKDNSEYTKPSEDALGTEDFAFKAAAVAGGVGIPPQPRTGQTVSHPAGRWTTSTSHRREFADDL